jgi:succinate dehydrogenase / fumarate reductase flavoprotein subunit
MNVIVVGSGIAGLCAAIKSSDLGADVTLISPNYSETSQSVMAMGGINASLNTKGENDSIQRHYEDTINGGCEINNPKAVERLTSDAPDIIRWLSSIGVSFTRDENSNVDLRYFGGQKLARTAYAGARTGKQIVSALIALCRKKEAEGSVNRLVGWRVLSLILDGNQCLGIICINEDTNEIKAFEGNVV